MEKVLLRLKHWFIPHEGNDNKPHILRNKATITFIIIVLLAEGLLFLDHVVFPSSKVLGVIINSVLVDETNQERVSADLSALRVNPILQSAAQAKANDMAAKSYFAHTSPEGITPWHWFDLYGYRYAYAGENLAVDFTDSVDVTKAWMNSPSHRANILNQHYTEIGMATAEGEFEGHKTIFVVELFGRPAVSPVSAPIAAAAKTPPPALAAKPTPPSGVTSSEVLGETKNVPEETFISTSSGEAPAPAVSNLENPEVPARSRFSFDLIANPRRAVDSVATFVLLLVLAALGFKLSRVGFMYPRLVRNGLIAIIICLAIIYANHAIASQITVFSSAGI